MKSLFFIFSFIFLAWVAGAQDGESFTLQESIEYALQHQADVQNSMLDTEIARAKVGETRSIGLPQLSGNGQIAYNPELKRMFFESGNPFIPTGTAPPGEIIAIPNVFQLKGSGDLSATLSQLIFNGSYFVGLQAAKTYKELAQRNLTQTRTNTIETVSKGFYLVLINRERAQLLGSNIARLDSSLKELRALYMEGFVEKIDVDRLEVNYNNLLTEKNRVDNLLQVSEMLLKYQMGMPVEQPITLEGSFADLQLDTTSLNKQVNFEDRPEYRLLQTNRELQRLNLKNERSSYLPSLSAFASGGLFTQHNDFTKMFSSTWYPYSLIGLNLEIPIFDGLGKHYRIKQARLELEKAENNLNNIENLIRFQVDQSYINLSNSLRTLNNQRQNMELAREVVRVAKIKYQEGVGSNLELVNAETDYREAQTNYYNALYDAIVAKIDYQKATGTLFNE